MDKNTLLSLFDELTKIAGKPVKENRKSWVTPSTRSGKRPMSVDTLLKKEKDGTLGGYKLATSSGNKVLFSEPYDAGAAKPKRRLGDIPSREEVGNQVKREDGRDFAHTLLSPATSMIDVGTTSQSETAK